jgi:hypothetical protein
MNSKGCHGVIRHAIHQRTASCDVELYGLCDLGCAMPQPVGPAACNEAIGRLLPVFIHATHLTKVYNLE